MPISISIAVDEPQRVYTCGDKISGSVLIKAEPPVLVKDLLVQLLCRAVTRTRGREQPPNASRLGDNESTSIPYCFVHKLVQQPKHLGAETPLPFVFTIPAATRRNQIEPAWQVSTIFEHRPDHAIPPTCKGERYGRTSVIHALEVIMHADEKHDGKHFAAFTQERMVNFSPCRAALNPDARCVKLTRAINSKVSRAHMSRLDPTARRRKSIVQLLTPEEKPSMTFQVEALCPTVLYAGGPVPISLSVISEQVQRQQRIQRQLTPPWDDEAPPSPSGAAPLIFVDGIYTYLEARTDRRIHLERTHKEHTLFEDEMLPICHVLGRPIAASTTPDHLTPLHSHYPELRLKSDVIPTFKSFSLRRRYNLRLRIRLIVGEQEHQIDLSTPVLILPGIHRNVAGATRDTGEMMPGLRRRISEETLPPYAETDPLAAGPSCMELSSPPPWTIMEIS